MISNRHRQMHQGNSMHQPLVRLISVNHADAVMLAFALFSISVSPSLLILGGDERKLLPAECPTQKRKDALMRLLRRCQMMIRMALACGTQEVRFFVRSHDPVTMRLETNACPCVLKETEPASQLMLDSSCACS